METERGKDRAEVLWLNCCIFRKYSVEGAVALYNFKGGLCWSFQRQECSCRVSMTKETKRNLCQRGRSKVTNRILLIIVQHGKE